MKSSKGAKRKTVLAIAVLLPIVFATSFYLPNSKFVTAVDSASALYPLPKSSTPASTLDVVKVRDSESITETITALQGLVNRNQPQIYTLHSPLDNYWLKYTMKLYGITIQNLTETQVLKQFASYVTDNNGNARMIIFDSNDPLYPMQSNIAKTLAGVYNALPVASADLPTIKGIFGTKISVLYDLRGEFQGKVAGYSWLWNLVGSQVNDKFLVMDNHGTYQLTDYVTEFKAFDFEFCCLSAAHTEVLNSSQLALANKIYSSYPEMAVSLGSFGLGGEQETVKYLSKLGDIMINSEEADDLSVFSGFPNANIQPTQSTSLTYSNSKTYVMFEFTNGDAFGFDYYSNFAQFLSVDQNTSKRYIDEVSAAWQISPILAEVAPPIIQGWYQEMNSIQSFMTGPSCAGYVFPDIMSDEAGFASACDKVTQATGLGTQLVDFTSNNKSSLTNVQTWLSDTSTAKALYLWEGYGKPNFMLNNTPVFYPSFAERAGPGYTQTDVQNAVNQIQHVAKTGNHFVYVIFTAINPGMSFIKAVMDKLGSSYVAVDNEEYTSLYIQSL